MEAKIIQLQKPPDKQTGKKYVRTKDIAAEIRAYFKPLNGVKLSVTADYDHINIKLMQAPFNALNEDKLSDYERQCKYLQLNHFYLMEDDRITKEAKTIFQMVHEIILKYHWDESDSMTDYFNCAFYYSFSVGDWNKPFAQL